VEVEVGASVATILVAVRVGGGVAVDSGGGAGEGVSGDSRKIVGSVQATVVTRRIIGGNRRMLNKRFIFIKASPFIAASNTCAE
jgi:hypothetical protein